MESKRPIFIVSTGRAGSKMIAKTLARHPETLSLHEPLPHLNIESFANWKGSHVAQEINRRVNNKRQDLLEQVEGNGLIYIESSHYCSHLIPILSELFGGGFIYLYRDGRDFVRSGLEREWWYTNNFFSSHLKGKGKVKQVLKRRVRRKFLIDMGYTWEDHRLLPPKKYKTRIEKISWLWVEINSVIQDSLSKLSSDKYIYLKLEEFNSGGVDRLLSFLDIKSTKKIKLQMEKVSKKKPNRTSNRTILPFDKWKKEEQKKFWKVAHNMMKTLKYI